MNSVNLVKDDPAPAADAPVAEAEKPAKPAKTKKAKPKTAKKPAKTAKPKAVKKTKATKTAKVDASAPRGGTVNVGTCVTPDEREKLIAYADKEGMSLSALLRKAAFEIAGLENVLRRPGRPRSASKE